MKVKENKNFDKKKIFFVIGDDVADLVASELGLQNRRKVSNDDSIILK
jgi:hypothetical protein